MDFYIKLEADAAKEFSITATGRDRETMRNDPGPSHSEYLPRGAEQRRSADHASVPPHRQRYPYR